jgi:hypothetical protein
MKTNLISKFKSILIFLVIVASLTSCRFGLSDPYPIGKSSNIVEEVIPLKNFDRLEIENSFKVIIKKGAYFSIIAKGDSYDIADLEAIVSSGKLKIRYKNNPNNRYEMTVFITMPHLAEANFYGSVLAEITNFSENKIRINTSGAADVYVNSDANTWDIDLSGASVIEMKGQGRKLFLEAGGSSDLFANNLFVDDIDLDISGTSQVSIFAYDEIFGRASGASEVYYRGNPLVDIKLSGTSWVTRK